MKRDYTCLHLCIWTTNFWAKRRNLILTNFNKKGYETKCYFDPVLYINRDEVEEQEAAEEALCSDIINDLKSRDEKILSLQKELD